MCNQIETLTPTLRIQLTTPAHDPRPLYLTCNFCNWAAGREEFKMTPAGDGFELPEGFQVPYPIEYKYTRGSWDQVEQQD